ncbi:MAG: hypothetical protein AMXMBFR64_61370 [Myxococcales bacterium]
MSPHLRPTWRRACSLFPILLFACSDSGGTLPSGGGGDSPGDPAGIGGFGGGPRGGQGGEMGPGGPADPGGSGDPGGRAPTDDSACIDLDGDGHGYLCVAGADCDDGNPHFTTACPDCATGNHPGCPCLDEGATSLCFSGNPDLVGTGQCAVGQRTCQQGWWSACIGEVPPGEEVCDGVDNDCDGEVDEGVKSECGNCDKFCHIYDAGAGTLEPFEPTADNSSSVTLTPEGWITLTESSFNMRAIWIANSAESTVSKLDTTTGNEVARYRTCPDPSRTAVAMNGDAWVACRGNGVVHKFRNIVEKCPDKNGNGVIETSRDLNGDGVISGDELLPEGQDECVLFSANPGVGGLARALGVVKDGSAWVGYWNESKLAKLHGDTGELLDQINLPVQPYGLAVDSKGLLWVSGRGGSKLVRVDPATKDVKAVSPGGCFEPYGIAIDEWDRVWIGNCCCGHVAWLYDPSNNAWASVSTGNRPRGIVSDKNGSVYVANDESSTVVKIDAATAKVVGTVSVGSGRFPIGVAVDGDGFVWAVNQSGSSATKIDGKSMTVAFEHAVGSGPYTYSDMTGSTFFKDLSPEGWYRTEFGGWEGFRVQWKTLSVDYVAPAGTWIEVRVRTANSKDELLAAPWSEAVGPFPPQTFPIDLVPLLPKKGNLLEVEVSLHAPDPDAGKPMVKGVEVTYSAEPQ